MTWFCELPIVFVGFGQCMYACCFASACLHDVVPELIARLVSACMVAARC